jgi:hypothetical protein
MTILVVRPAPAAMHEALGGQYLSKDLATGRIKSSHRSIANRAFYSTLTPAQRNFVHSIYSWTIEKGPDTPYVVELTVLDERQVTLANMLF